MVPRHLTSLTVVLLCICLTATLILRFWFESQLALTSKPEAVLLSRDPRLARFSNHCEADVDFEDDSSNNSTGQYQIQIHRVVALFSYGEGSPVATWPDDPKPPPSWDCRPADLPRHWRLNQKVKFQAAHANGTFLDRTFFPDTIEVQETPEEQADPMLRRRKPCAPQQLTSTGFHQAVLMGRRLGARYDQLLASFLWKDPKALDLRSVDVTRSLATAVGVMMSFLATSQTIGSFDAGTVVPIHIFEEPLLATPRLQEVTRALVAGDDLLKRWCHHGSLPCKQQPGQEEDCTTPKEASEIVSHAEQHFREAIHSEPLPWLKELFYPLASSITGSFAVWSVDGHFLAAILLTLLRDADMSKDPLVIRPPVSSLLIVERWSSQDKFAFTLLWNGRDISKRIAGCQLIQRSETQFGCEEESFLKLLQLH